MSLLSRSWRKASESRKVYAHQLSRCPTFPASHKLFTGPFTDDSLTELKRKFILEAKRNLYGVFTSPRQTNISIISTTTGSSGGFPFGEPFDFVFSPLAQWCLAVSSSRIILIDTVMEDVAVKREFKVVRKPLSSCITDNGARLAVLSTENKASVYDISDNEPRLLRWVILDDNAQAVALTKHGEVLAVATEAGIEVYSLADNATLTDKRTVKCDRVDCLSFSDDGTMLLGTTHGSKAASTVILSAPYFADSAEHDMPHSQLISHIWTSQILFPNSSRDCSHATLLPRTIDHDANWALAYDRVFESFRAVRTDDLRNGTTYFTGPKPRREREQVRSKSTLVPCTLPSTTPKGELVAAGFLGSEIWLYGVPEDLDNPGVTMGNLNDSARATSAASTSAAPSLLASTSIADIEGLPRWQVLVDKHRNVFAKGRRIAKVSGASQVCWSSRPQTEDGLKSVRERLIVAAPGGVSALSDIDAEEMVSADGGRLVVLDFDRSPRAGSSRDFVFEVGNVEPQVLPEERTDMATEIAIVRRRTVARRDGMPRSYVASVVDVLRPVGEAPPAVPPVPRSFGFGLDSTEQTQRPLVEPTARSSVGSDGIGLDEAVDALDGPYSHTSPRSRNTLYRSATAVEANRLRNPPPVPGTNTGPLEFRRMDGTELPHESDADNWVPPPPPYTRDADGPLPDHLRPIFGPSASPALSQRERRPTRSSTAPDSVSDSPSHRRRSSADVDTLATALNRWGSISAERPNLLSRSESVTHKSTTTSPPPLSPSTSTRSTRSRRPISSYEPLTSLASSARVALRPAPTLQITDEPMQASPSQSPIAPRTDPPRSSPLTLSGSNLQQRLDYPLPPPPKDETPSEVEGDREPEPEHDAQTTTRPVVEQVTEARAVGSLVRPTTQSRSVSDIQPLRTLPATEASPITPASRPRTPEPVRTSPEPSAYQLNNLNLQSCYGSPPHSPRSPHTPGSPPPPPAARSTVRADDRRVSRFRAAFRRVANPPPPQNSRHEEASPARVSRLRRALSLNASAPNLRRRPVDSSLDAASPPDGAAAAPPPPRPAVADDAGGEPRSSGRRMGQRLTRRFTRSLNPLRLETGEAAGASPGAQVGNVAPHATQRQANGHEDRRASQSRDRRCHVM